MDRCVDACRFVRYAHRTKQVIVELRQMLTDEIITADAGLRRNPPDPIPEVGVNGDERRRARRHGGSRILRLLEE